MISRMYTIQPGYVGSPAPVAKKKKPKRTKKIAALRAHIVQLAKDANIKIHIARPQFETIDGKTVIIGINNHPVTYKTKTYKTWKHTKQSGYSWRSETARGTWERKGGTSTDKTHHIYFRNIETPTMYGRALFLLGICHNKLRIPKLDFRVNAWTWAKEHALVWTPQTHQLAKNSILRALISAKSPNPDRISWHGGIRTQTPRKPKKPIPPDHPCFSWVTEAEWAAAAWKNKIKKL